MALVEPGGDVRTGEGRAAVQRTAATVAKDPDVAQVVTAFNGGGDALISKDGDSVLPGGLLQARSATTPSATRPPASRTPWRTTRRCASAAPPWWASTSAPSSAQDLARAEMIAFPIIFLLSLWVFRGVIAALLPLADGRAW